MILRNVSTSRVYHRAMSTLADRVASLVHGQFAALSRGSKPRVLENGSKEWVPLSGIVLRNGAGELRCVAVATGTKCLPENAVPTARGLLLHDSHAEILAIRAFNRFLLDECRSVLQSAQKLPDQGGNTQDQSQGQRYSPIVQRNTDKPSRLAPSYRPLSIHHEIEIYLYCSKAPCGDASMELVMQEQEDATPWQDEKPVILDDTGGTGSTADPIDEMASIPPPLHGRGFFSSLGIVRRKPARPDAPATLSKSCSDKLSIAQCLSLLRTPVSLLISPANAYVKALIVPRSEYTNAGFSRAWSDEGRMSALKGKTWEGEYAFKPFDVLTTGIKEFEFSRGSKASNVSAIWTAGPGYVDGDKVEVSLNEAVINGVKQGWNAKRVIGQETAAQKGTSGVCRANLWRLSGEVGRLLLEKTEPESDDGDLRWILEALNAGTYGELKRSKILAARRRAQSEVRGVLAPRSWVRNTGDDEWTL